MRRGKQAKQEAVTTYISTLTVNFGNKNKPKSKSHPESQDPTPKRHHVRSTGAHNNDVSSTYRQPHHSTGTYYQLTKPSSNRKEEPEHHNTHKVTSFNRSKAYFEGLNTDGGSRSNSFSSQDEQRQKYEKPYYNDKSESSKISPPTAVEPELYECKYKPPMVSSSASSVKTRYSPETHSPKTSSSSATRYEKPYYNDKSESSKISPPTAVEPELYECEYEPPMVSSSVSSVKTRYSPETHSSPKTSSSSAIRGSTTSTVSQKITTTTTTEEKETLSCGKSEVKSTKPAADYGETDWYLDILLRMQSLEMKQQSLHAQYDFLGKLSQENREDLKQARDWARYDADNYEVEVY